MQLHLSPNQCLARFILATSSAVILLLQQRSFFTCLWLYLRHPVSILIDGTPINNEIFTRFEKNNNKNPKKQWEESLSTLRYIWEKAGEIRRCPQEMLRDAFRKVSWTSCDRNIMNPYILWGDGHHCFYRFCFCVGFVFSEKWKRNERKD